MPTRAEAARGGFHGPAGTEGWQHSSPSPALRARPGGAPWLGQLQRLPEKGAHGAVLWLRGSPSGRPRSGKTRPRCGLDWARQGSSLSLS